jgi:hypothetical protein
VNALFVVLGRDASHMALHLTELEVGPLIEIANINFVKLLLDFLPLLLELQIRAYALRSGNLGSFYRHG